MAPRRRNPKGAWVLRAIAALLLLDDPHRDRLRRRALRSPHFHSPIWKFARSGTLRVNTHARHRLYFHHGLLGRPMPDWKKHVRDHLALLRLPPEREMEITEELAQHLEAAWEEALGGGA